MGEPKVSIDGRTVTESALNALAEDQVKGGEL